MIKILIVDDHEFIRKAIAQFIHLQKDMQVVAEASDGVEAVEMFDQVHPDLALVDLYMPQMNGIETTIAIRKNNPDAKVIIISAYPAAEEVERAICAGACAYITKDEMKQLLPEMIRGAAAEKKIFDSRNIGG
jgi:DNA-binding NarL/FixJ family response regulator